MSMTTPTPHEVDELVERIRLLLRGQGPELLGAALADPVAMFFAGHHPAMRQKMKITNPTALAIHRSMGFTLTFSISKQRDHL
jgi:hypothetical protein